MSLEGDSARCKMAEKNLILKILVGSHLYGSNTPESDKDYMGVFMPPKECTLGMSKYDQVIIRTNPEDSGRQNTKNDIDCVLYSLPKFIELAMNNNPNIIELFYAPQKNIVFESRYGGELLGNAHLFLSKKVKHTFCGYAHSQKMKLLDKQPIGNRKANVDKYGFDTKFASHLIRLLTEGIQFLIEGEITLPLSNRRELRDIKTGKLDLNYVLRKTLEYEQLIEQAYVNSELQNAPRYNEIEQMQINMLEKFYYKGKV